MKLKKIVRQIYYFFRDGWVVGWVGGRCGRIENKAISAFNLVKVEVGVELKVKLSLAITAASSHSLFEDGHIFFITGEYGIGKSINIYLQIFSRFMNNGGC